MIASDGLLLERQEIGKYMQRGRVDHKHQMILFSDFETATNTFTTKRKSQNNEKPSACSSATDTAATRIPATSS
jgi:hypothetical protein